MIIKLTDGTEVIVDEEDYVRLALNTWYRSGNYAIRHKGPRGASIVIYMHHEVLEMPPDQTQVVDHINRNTFDNQKQNLRLADKAKNSMNRGLQANSTTGYKGVSFHKGMYDAYIKLNGKKKHLGRFFDAKAAAETYDMAAEKLFGEFACLNFPKTKV